MTDFQTTPATAREWITTLSKYKEARLSRSVTEIVMTAGLFLLSWAAALYSTQISYFLTIPLCVVVGLFLVRLFLIQHDCSHGAFFKSRNANHWVGRVIGIVTFTPFDLWQRTHLLHHSGHGNLDKRGIGDVYTMTVEEYENASKWERFKYRMYRHPIVLFGLGPSFVFFLYHRLPFDCFDRVRYWVSTMVTNLAIVGIIIGGGLVFGWAPFLTILFLSTAMAATLGVWLFYVQHQFEGVQWDMPEDWQLHEAALYGSTYYIMPKWFQWMTANIGIHHVHHLYSKIPYYRLPEVLKKHPRLAQIRRLTIMESFKTTRLKLWDAGSRQLVTFRAAKEMAKARMKGAKTA